jgi:hypothetical protein
MIRVAAVVAAAGLGIWSSIGTGHWVASCGTLTVVACVLLSVAMVTGRATLCGFGVAVLAFPAGVHLVQGASILVGVGRGAWLLAVGELAVTALEPKREGPVRLGQAWAPAGLVVGAFVIALAVTIAGQAISRGGATWELIGTAAVLALSGLLASIAFLAWPSNRRRSI